MVNLGTITNLQTLRGIRLASFDDNSHEVPVDNGFQFSADQPGCIMFSGSGPDQAAVPAGSAFFIDIIGKQPSDGPVTITFTGQKPGSGAPFTSQAQITITLDPSLPGQPTNWQITPGTVVAQ